MHFTGSAAHNVRLRERARDHGLEPLGARLRAAGRRRRGARRVDAAELRTFATEDEVYDFLGLPFIEPELREDRGEIEAALAGRLPRLVAVDDLQGDCHTHSEWSDGKESIETMAETARRRGYAYQVLTDHTWSLTIANGLTPERRWSSSGGSSASSTSGSRARRRQGRRPRARIPIGFRLLHGCELEIRVDGRLDYDDDAARPLRRRGRVPARGPASSRAPSSWRATRRRCAARTWTSSPTPRGARSACGRTSTSTGTRFYRLAAETGTLLEVNGSDERLDLDDRRIRSALDAGCRFTIDSDAHYLSEWDNVIWGTAQARRGWLEARHVANTLPRDAFLALMAEKPHRV